MRLFKIPRTVARLITHRALFRSADLRQLPKQIRASSDLFTRHVFLRLLLALAAVLRICSHPLSSRAQNPALHKRGRPTIPHSSNRIALTDHFASSAMAIQHYEFDGRLLWTPRVIAPSDNATLYPPFSGFNTIASTTKAKPAIEARTATDRDLCRIAMTALTPRMVESKMTTVAFSTSRQ
jgi:hypothetical protein